MTSHFDKHGGPAFPQVSTNPDGDLYQPGMTLRDYFAAKAMQGLLSDPDWRQDMNFDNTALAAYKMADAMIKARQQ